MKKSIRALALGLTATATLTASAAAANFTHCADTLNTLGLFAGGEAGYELDKAPTRAEAAVMLVRLLGKEAEAKALTYTAPFTDLKGWEQPYVQYLYDNQLASGLTETTFGPNAACNAQMYTTFLLRALGYSDAAGDFTYETAMNTARELSLVDMANCNEQNFLRDNVVAMSYTALNTAPKGETSTTLLDKLVADGAVAADKAQATQTFFNNYKALMAVSNTDAMPSKYEMDFDMNADISINGQEGMSLDMKMNAKMDMNMENMDKTKMAMTGDMAMTITEAAAKALGEQADSAGTETIKIEYYYDNGTYYMNMNMGDETQKLKMPMSLNDAMDSFGGMEQMTSVSSNPICLFDSLVVDGNTYSMSFTGDALSGLVDSMLGSASLDTASLDALGMEMKLGKVSVTQTVTDNHLDSMQLQMPMNITVAGESMDVTMNMDAKITKVGDTVTVTLPTDLADYQDMSEAAGV